MAAARYAYLPATQKNVLICTEKNVPEDSRVSYFQYFSSIGLFMTCQKSKNMTKKKKKQKNVNVICFQETKTTLRNLIVF